MLHPAPLNTFKASPAEWAENAAQWLAHHRAEDAARATYHAAYEAEKTAALRGERAPAAAARIAAGEALAALEARS